MLWAKLWCVWKLWLLGAYSKLHVWILTMSSYFRTLDLFYLCRWNLFPGGRHQTPNNEGDFQTSHFPLQAYEFEAFFGPRPRQFHLRGLLHNLPIETDTESFVLFVWFQACAVWNLAATLLCTICLSALSALSHFSLSILTCAITGKKSRKIKETADYFCKTFSCACKSTGLRCTVR